MDWLKENILNVIAFAVLALFIGVWAIILERVWTYDPTDTEPQLALATGIVMAAGLLATTIGTVTASALGFTIAEVKAKSLVNAGVSFNAQTVGAQVTTSTLAAILAYIAVGLGVFFTWVYRESASPEVVSVFALSLLGWLVGAAGIAFKSVSET
jgi:hypothetical protein